MYGSLTVVDDARKLGFSVRVKPQLDAWGCTQRSFSLIVADGWIVDRVDAPVFVLAAEASVRPTWTGQVGLIDNMAHPRAAPDVGEHTVGKKLYCGNLSYGVSSSDLEDMFAKFGTVESAQVISDRDSGRSKGFGFVEMASDAEAQAAIEALNAQEHEGRALTVNEARPREDRSRGGFGGGGRRGGGGGGRY